MTSHTSSTLREKLLQFFAKHPNEQFKPQVLAHRLGLKGQEDFRLLQQALNELFQSKEITRGRRKRYGHGIPPAAKQLVGVLDILKNGSGIVRIPAPEARTITIPSRFMGTALDGDTVGVALFASTKPDAQQEDEVLEGEIVEVLERSNVPIVGVFSKGKHFAFVVPDNRIADRDIYIPQGKTKGARPGDKVVCQVDSWESRNLSPEGHVVEVLGKAGEVSAEMMAVAREFQLPLRFPKEVVSEAEKIGETIPREEYDKRLDLRDLLCFTIDPEDAKDFDDAVSLEELKDGNFKLGIHIADVSYYVQEGSALDREALKRGTSVYLANEVIPMLPEKLSNNLCSLRPKEDRLAYSAFVIMTPRGIVKDYQIEKSVIHSKHRFTYEEVQKIIEKGRGEFSDTIKRMHEVSRALLSKRMKNGALDFETVETKFRFDEHGKPKEILKKVRLDAHRLVEEFMLMANQTVAHHIAAPKKETGLRPFIYRIHDSPPPEKLKDLASFVEHLGYSLHTNGGGITSRSLQKLLSDVKGKDEESVINEVAIRSMAKALYSETNVGHFGLAFQHYTHFTSPIRRYPDLVVHRLLYEYAHKMLQKRREQLIEQVPEICEIASDRERIAQNAERASVKVMQVEYMKRHLGDEFHAIISGVTNFGLFVEITDLLVEGLIHVRDLGDDYYTFDEKNYALIGRKGKKRFRLGDMVQVQVVRVDPEERKIDFRLVEEAKA